MPKNTSLRAETLKAWRAQFGLPKPEKTPQESENAIFNVNIGKKWASKQ